MKSYIKSLRNAFFGVLLVLTFLAAPARAQFVMGNVTGPGNIVSVGTTGFVVNQANFYAAYLTGTAYTMTNSAAAIVGGTTSPTITLPAAGTYFIYSDLDMNEVGATYTGGQTATLEFYRTNNTPGVLTSSPAIFTFPPITTQTASAATMNVHGLIYTTTNSNDVVTVYGVLSATPSAGSITISGGGIYALRLY
jgi:hypothetical protein